MRPRVFTPPIVESEGEALGQGAGDAFLASTAPGAAAWHGAAAAPAADDANTTNVARHRRKYDIRGGAFRVAARGVCPLERPPTRPRLSVS
jgi:hypothetical protein